MLVLASNSPRRKQLLALAGWEYQACPPEGVDETPLEGEEPGEYVLRLAREKAIAANCLAPGGSVIVAADTTVVDAGEILGKPASPAEAAEMLRRLRGRVHQVCSGLAVLPGDGGQVLTELCVTQVKMRAYTEDEIQAYVATGDPLDKAGAYAIQHRGFDPVESLEGCFTNVVGLPLCHLTRLLEKVGLLPGAGAAIACRDTENYECTARRAVLD